MSTGRPTKYKECYPQEMIEWFKRVDYITRSKQIATASGRIADIEETLPCDYPTFAGYAVHISVCMDTLTEWRKVYPAFSSAYKECKAIQTQIICKHTLKGDYNASFAKFLMINNLGYKEKIETENTNKEIVVNIDKQDSEL